MPNATGSVDSTRDAFLLNEAPGSRRITKYENYFEIYDRYLKPYVGTDATIVEIGVQHGGSLQMWRSFLGPKARIIGVDINKDCLQFAEEGTEVYICDQSEPAFVDGLARKIGKADIIIDDGSHIPSHQRITFDSLFFEVLEDGGFYIVEDCHTSYSKRYGGGLRARGSFIEFAKRLSDQLNFWHAHSPKIKNDRYAQWVSSVSFYSSVVVFEKKRGSAPAVITAGDKMLDLNAPFKGSNSKLVLALKKSEIVQRLVRTNPRLWKMMRERMYR